MSFLLVILLIILIIPVIFIKFLSLFYLFKKYTLFAIIFIAFICVIALLTKPSDDKFYRALENQHGLECNDIGICTAGQYVYTIQQASSTNFGIFKTYHLKMTYEKGKYEREINSLGAFQNIFTYTFR